MTGSGEREEATPGVSDGTATGSDRKSAKRAAKAAEKAAKGATRAAKAASSEVKRAARKSNRAAQAELLAARAAAKSEAKMRTAAAKARKAEAKAAKAVARASEQASRRARKAEAAARAASPAASHASGLLEAAAALIRQGEASAEAKPAQPAQPAAAQDAESVAAPQPEPQPEPDVANESGPVSPAAQETVEPEPEPEPEPHAAEPDAVRPEAAPERIVELPAGELPAGELPAALLGHAVSAPRPSVPPGALVAASIDVGSTSVHLLVGIVDGHGVVPLLDESVFLGLGDRVSAEGYLGADLRAALVADLVRYAAAARELGAASITVVGTEPMRRAGDAPAVIRDVEVRAGVPLHVLDQAEEGLVTLIGATGGSPVSGELLLVDIGGGSTEFVVVGAGGQPRTVGLSLGAARLTRELVHSDPPSLAEVEALRDEVARIVVDAPDASPTEIVAVGGTASNLLRLLPATAVDRSLTRRRVAVALAMLTVERSSEAASRHLIRPERARILPAGALIVDAVLEKYGADRLRVSEAGVREGAILAAVHGGVAWRDRLALLARGWPGPSSRG